MVLIGAFIYLCIHLSLVLFSNVYKRSLPKQIKKNLDIGLKHIYFIYSNYHPCWYMDNFKTVKADEKLKTQLSIALTFSILFGFISLLILGQTFKKFSFLSLG